MEDLRQFLLDSAPTAADKETVEAAWASPGTALLIAERVLNLAPQLSVPLLDGLMQEVKQAGLDFKNYITVTRVFEDPTKQGSYIHATPDGECLEKLSAWNFSFAVKGKAVGDDEFKPYRMAMMIKGENMDKVVEDLKELIPME